ncbi:MAG: hypothetical protein LUE64_04775 [Candidatus Gastranaerophilales bacterium]|nr:hypothetical protein [Candidatus Gastranaerophilales bacterium]
MGFEKIGSMAGKFLKNCVEHNSTFLFITSAAGWALASTAQTIGLAANKEIPKEEKKFLVPQEILDGTFNIASYAAISLPLMKGVEKLAQSKFPNNNKAVEGARCLAAIAGGIVSSNIITPVLRNKTGAIVKEKMESKNLTPPPAQIYDGKTQPFFRAKNPPLSIQSYMNFTKSMPNSGSLRI